jgi:hypothetical protein
MGLINWIFDFYQHSQIDRAREETRQMRSELASMHGNGFVNGEKLERALGELALATKTLQRMLVEKGVCTADELAQRMRAIDLEDGVADGRGPLG